MIVVDTNVIAALLLPSEATAVVERLHARDPDWAAPPLWRSELRNVLVNQVRSRGLKLTAAEASMELATEMMAPLQQDVLSPEVLRLAAQSGCSAYDCEFVALALLLEVPLATFDRAVRRAFPRIAVAPEDLERYSREQ